jgi:F-type H+-transporting ATPase subunit b
MSSNFGFNTDLLETNVLNLVVVVGVVVTVVGDAFRTLLDQRRQIILTTLEDVKQKARTAQDDFVEATEAVETARLYAQEIRMGAVSLAEQERIKIQKQLQKELQRIKERGRQALQIEYQRTIQVVTKQVTQIALLTAENTLSSALGLINEEPCLFSSKQAELNETHIRETFRQVKGWSSTLSINKLRRKKNS